MATVGPANPRSSRNEDPRQNEHKRQKLQQHSVSAVFPHSLRTKLPLKVSDQRSAFSCLALQRKTLATINRVPLYAGHQYPLIMVANIGACTGAEFSRFRGLRQDSGSHDSCGLGNGPQVRSDRIAAETGRSGSIGPFSALRRCNSPYQP